MNFELDPSLADQIEGKEKILKETQSESFALNQKANDEWTKFAKAAMKLKALGELSGSC